MIAASRAVVYDILKNYIHKYTRAHFTQVAATSLQPLRDTLWSTIHAPTPKEPKILIKIQNYITKLRFYQRLVKSSRNDNIIATSEP